VSELPPAIDLERLVEELKQRLEERRAAGVYPPELEDQLDEHARQFASHRMPRPDPLPPLRDAVAEVGRKRDIRREDIEPSSSVPLGSHIHRAADKLQRRQIDSLVAQVWSFAAAVTEALERSVAVFEQPSRDDDAVLEQMDSMLERIRALEAGAALGGALGSVIDRIERLEAAERDRGFSPFFSNADFEASFRGSQEELKERYAELADFLVSSSCDPVVDIGCGQGMLLELLADRGISAVGVELDDELARLGQAKGLKVEEGNGLHYLQEQQDGSLGAIVLLQVIEHLTHQQVADLFPLAYRKLRPAGVLAVETVNPQSLYVYARAFYLDPTHTTPVHPAYLGFLAGQAGFSGHRIEWRSPVPEGEALDADDDDAQRLNSLLYGPQDYMFLGVR
jgi:SAM-dependent methyltransferase